MPSVKVNKPTPFEWLVDMNSQPDMGKENGDLELQWLASHPGEVEKHEGKYIAISKDGILGSGDTAGEALKKAKKAHPGANPAIMLVPSGDLVL